MMCLYYHPTKQRERNLSQLCVDKLRHPPGLQSLCRYNRTPAARELFVYQNSAPGEPAHRRLATSRKPVKIANVLFCWLTQAFHTNLAQFKRPGMSAAPAGRVRAVPHPLRRACPHTCPPSHPRPPVRTLIS